MRLTFDIISWGAWSPLYQEAEDWQHWQAPSDVPLTPVQPPKLQQIPPNQRRRLSPLTKMLLSASFQAQPPSQCRSIFASQHGEINRTMSLLDDITHQHSLSPTSFSQSVHNTASGVFSILTGNQAASTAIAAGSASLSQAFIEAYGLLHEKSDPILLVYGDEPVPPIFKAFNCQPEWPISMAFVLTKASSNRRFSKLTINTINEINTDITLHYGQILQAIACKTPLSGTINNQHWSIHCD